MILDSVQLDRRSLLMSAVSVIATRCIGCRVFAKDKNMSNSKHHPQSALTYDEVRSVSPALENYTKGALLSDLWGRPELSARDRSLATVAALIARIQTIEMPFHFACVRQWSNACGAFRDHYTSGVLFWLGKCNGRCVRGEGSLRHAVILEVRQLIPIPEPLKQHKVNRFIRRLRRS